MGKTQTTQLIQRAVLKLTDDEKYADGWISDETLLRLTTTNYTGIADAISFTREQLNRALSNTNFIPTGGGFKSTNINGVYKCSFFTACPYDPSKERQVSFYYRHKNGEPPAEPARASDVQDAVAQCHRIQQNRERISPSEKLAREMDPVGKSIAGLIRENKKKQKKSGNKNDNTDTPKRSTNLPAVTPAKRTPIHNTQQPFWYSPECKKLFGYDKSVIQLM
ncbi:MAG: hypothetical protein ACQ9ET_05200 [Nitrosomonadaceae bacterium]